MKAIQKQTIELLILRETTDFHFTENYRMDFKLGLRFISKIDQRQEYLKVSFIESVEQTKPGGF